jgi:FlaA1/EpsC-like NDP-sugar epimerase
MQPFESNVGAILDTTLSQRIDQASSLIPRRWQWRFFTIALVITDIAMTGLAFRFAYFLRFQTGWNIFMQDTIPRFDFYQTLVVLLLLLWLIIFALNGLYNRQNLLGGTREYERIFRSTLVGFIFVVLVGFILPELIIARGWLFMAWALSFFFASLGRFIIRRLVYLLRRKGFYLTPAIIIGGNQEGRWLAQQLISWGTSGLHVVGFVDKKVPAGTPLYHGLCSLGRVE